MTIQPNRIALWLILMDSPMSASAGAGFARLRGQFRISQASLQGCAD